MKTAWITGAGGLIGSHIVRNAPDQWHARGLTRAEFDLTDFAAVRAAFRREQPQLVIHCAAMSKTLACESNPAQAQLHNVEVTRLLAELATDIPLIFFSTDIVFDGQRGNYKEDDAPNPLCVYAETKLAAEKIVLAHPQHTVIRTSLNAGKSPRGPSSFSELWRAAWQRGETTRLFTDEFRSPIAAAVTARAVWELVAVEQPGLYHLAGSERLSRFAIGELVAQHPPTLPARIEPDSVRDYQAMRRSPDTSLDIGKIQELLSTPLPCFSNWLRQNPTVEI